mmetsp:Transcript_148313/g.413114  ORF Transcript_148313/g.413114 Transcript_148313/m.413114 type:complete len:251 (+) Transcript_148313:840-1592(+)
MLTRVRRAEEPHDVRVAEFPENANFPGNALHKVVPAKLPLLHSLQRARLPLCIFHQEDITEAARVDQFGYCVLVSHHATNSRLLHCAAELGKVIENDVCHLPEQLVFALSSALQEFLHLALLLGAVLAQLLCRKEPLVSARQPHLYGGLHVRAGARLQDHVIRAELEELANLLPKCRCLEKLALPLRSQQEHEDRHLELLRGELLHHVVRLHLRWEAGYNDHRRGASRHVDATMALPCRDDESRLRLQGL